jgi:hypothetical protein
MPASVISEIDFLNCPALSAKYASDAAQTQTNESAKKKRGRQGARRAWVEKQ